MKKAGFTLMEMMVVVVVIGILATLGFPAYKNVIEDSKARACQTNLKAISAALDIYAMEHDSIPADLSKLPSEYLERAYAGILREKGSWKIKLAYFIVSSQERGVVYAQTGILTNDLTRGVPNLRQCPSAPVGATHSYGLNSAIKNLTSMQYRALAGSTLLVGDTRNNAVEFSAPTDLDSRHRRYKILSTAENFALACNKGKNVTEENKSEGQQVSGRGRGVQRGDSDREREDGDQGKANKIK